MSLLQLPNELLEAVAHELTSPKDISAFSRTCARVFDTVVSHLYRHDCIHFNSSALSWAATHGRTDTVHRAVSRAPEACLLQHLAIAVEHGHAAVAKQLLAVEQLREPLTNIDKVRMHEARSNPLWRAAETGNTDIVRLLLAVEGIFHNVSDARGWCPLHVAADRKNTEIVRLLAQCGADINASSNDGATPLAVAANRSQFQPMETFQLMKTLLEAGADATSALPQSVMIGKVDIVRLLLDYRANVEARSKNGHSVLGLAAIFGSLDTAELLLERGADVNASFGPDNTALHLSKHSMISCMLLQNGADVNARDAQGHTPLARAAMTGDAENVKVLLEHGADASLGNVRGTEPLHIASKQSRFTEGTSDVVKTLLAWGANANAVDSRGQTPLHLATNMEGLDMIKILVDGGANIDAVDNRGRTALLLAARGGSEDIVDLLLRKGAEVECVDDQNMKALVYSVNGNCSIDILRAFLERGADPHALGDTGRSTVHLATCWGLMDHVQLLLDHGVDPNLADNDGVNPLMSAATRGAIDLMELFLGHGSNINRRDGRGWTALMMACQHAKARPVQWLLEHGADVKATNVDGQTALDIQMGLTNRNPKIVDALVQWAAAN